MKNVYNDEVEVMVLIAEDASKGPATLGYCKQWAMAHGDPDAMYTYLDISGGVSWNNTFSNIENYGNGGIGLPCAWCCCCVSASSPGAAHPPSYTPPSALSSRPVPWGTPRSQLPRYRSPLR